MQELHTRKSASATVHGQWYEAERASRQIAAMFRPALQRQSKPGFLARLFKKK